MRHKLFYTLLQLIIFSMFILMTGCSKAPSDIPLATGTSLAFDTIISFSDKPMRLMVQMGLLVTLAAFIVGIVFIVRYCMGLIEVMGFASLIISLWLLGGIIISLIGVVGIYLGKLFEKAKERPTFIVNEKCNIE